MLFEVLMNQAIPFAGQDFADEEMSTGRTADSNLRGTLVYLEKQRYTIRHIEG
jgi:hypothetical protein